ncbi:MAG: nitroreductase family protein [Candidatus Hodarchaeales archaeon]|jgi:nitroreductase
MDFFEVIIRNKRFKDFKPDQPSLTSDQLKQLIACAQLAPSLSNIQNFTYVIIDDEDLKNKISDSIEGSGWIRNAAAIFAVIVVIDESEDDTNIIDAIIASSQLMLAATATHLGSSLLVDFDTEIIGNLVGITEEWNNLEVIALIPVGETLNEGSQGYKRTLKELSSQNTLGNPFPYD